MQPADPARRGLHNQVIPRVSQTPSFVAGYWLEPLDGKGISVTLWQSEQAARKAAVSSSPRAHRRRESRSTGSKRGSDWAGLARSRTDLGTSRVGRGWCTVGLHLFTRALPMGA
jgi:hypothetical protein